ncbi:MAG: hypothetical protein WCH86_00245 [Kiritimatiellales bacterium]
MTDDEIRKRFEEYRDNLLDECQYFVACVHISKRFREQQIKNPKLVNTAPCYWAVSMKSVFVSIVLWGEKLFGDHAKSKWPQMDFWEFIDFLKENRQALFSTPIYCEEESWGVTSDDIEAHLEKLKSLEGMKVIKHLRDKYYAHFDEGFFLDRKKLRDGTDINFAALENMGNVAQEILLHYSLAYNGEGFSVKAANVDDVTGLFGLIERYFDERKKSVNMIRKEGKKE